MSTAVLPPPAEPVPAAPRPLTTGKQPIGVIIALWAFVTIPFVAGCGDCLAAATSGPRLHSLTKPYSTKEPGCLGSSHAQGANRGRKTGDER